METPPAGARFLGAAGLRLLGWVVLVLRVGVLDPLEILRAHSINDYASFHFAAVAVVHGEDPYSGSLAHYAAAERVAAHPYIYPPFLACVLIPSSWLGVWPARLVWEAASIAAVLATVLLLHRWIDATRGEHAGAAKTAITVVAALFWPLRESAWMGQVNAFVLLLTLLWWVHRDRSRWAGVWLGVAIAIKMSPAILVLWVLTQKKWREAATVLGSAASLIGLSCLAMGSRWSVFPSTVLSGFLPGHAYHSFTIPIHFFGNESLADLAYALTGNRGGDDFRLGPSAALLQLAFLGVLLVVWALASRRSPPEHSLGALMILMILAPTYAWEHHLAFALFAVAILVDASLRSGTREALISWIVIAWMCEPYTAFAWPDGALAGRLGALGALPKIVPLLAVFFLLVRDGLGVKWLGRTGAAPAGQAAVQMLPRPAPSPKTKKTARSSK